MDSISQQDKYRELRGRWPVFHYHGWTLEETPDRTVVTWRFEVPGLAVFEPTLEIPAVSDGRGPANALDTPLGRRILLSLGMVELVSYWKAVCSPTVLVHAGWLYAGDIAWWKTLYRLGLGEFFYRNGIPPDPEGFMDLRCDVPDPAAARAEAEAAAAASPALPGGNLVPVGGGKDSVVTLELLADRRSANVPFFINPSPAGRDTAAVAGYPAGRTLSLKRTLHPRLLELNRLGFLNGHTPFSAIIAFSAWLSAYRFGYTRIVLSNEASANAGNLPDMDVNHQYSKSYAFEKSFMAYARRNFGGDILYFSLLRPFNELQIARRFAAADPRHREVFRSCNAGSRENRWCGRCPKCLFVRLILAPFLPPDELDRLLGGALLDDPARIVDFEGLTGLAPVKPFECVGEAEEVRCAVERTILRNILEAREQPLLLRHYAARMREIRGKKPSESAFPPSDIEGMLSRFDTEHGIPEDFMEPVLRMRDYVASDLE
ncbi:MAG: hypothetical protein KBA30_05555 [Clostridia bacterium]|nr:hypothetical protein [Clostridia bacterium]